MAKTEKKRKTSSVQQPKKKSPFQKKRDDRVNKVSANSKAIAKPSNPFEVKVNKQRFQVLGRPTKHERGLPGVSRSRALKKRSETLLVEYQNRHKSNRFVDRRLGENDTGLSVEAKMEMRFLAHKIKSHNKKSKFLLGDDEVLTHRGQTLADVDKFDDPRSDDEDDADARLGGAFVSEAHFGGGDDAAGGLLTKADDSEAARRNRESLIDNLIADSKKRKVERQKEKEETDDLTDKLDAELKGIQSTLFGILIPSKKAAADGTSTEEPLPMPPPLPNTAYDILMRELRFDARVRPTNKLQDEEQLARIEKEKLERLEAERLRRMHGDDASKKVPHRSADDLDDGFALYEEKVPASQPDEEERKATDIEVVEATAEDNRIDSDDEDASGEEEEDDDDDDGEEEEGSDEEDSDAGDNYSDLATSDEEGQDDDDTKAKAKAKVKAKTETPAAKKSDTDDMPFVFPVPEEYDEFCDVVQAYGVRRQRLVLQRMVKCNHAALDNGASRARLEKLFAFLVLYVHDVADSKQLPMLDELAPVMFDVAQLVPSSSVATTLLDVLHDKRNEFVNDGKKKTPASVATLVFLKLTALLCPTSDFRHSVATPAVHLLLELLLCPVATLDAVRVGLALCTVAYEFVSLSKRFVPEVVHYLHGLVRLAVPRPTGVAARGLAPPFRPVGAESRLLVLDADADADAEATRSIVLEPLRLTETDESDRFRVTALYTAVRLLEDFQALWTEQAAAHVIFAPVRKSLEALPLDGYPEAVRSAVDRLFQAVDRLEREPRKRLVHEAKRPKPLRLLDPLVEEKWEGKKKHAGSKEKQERDKLQHKLRREMKGAIREIRKDTAFLGRQKLNEQIQRDNERKRKVKELMGSLANQEGEVKKMTKVKKKKK